MYLAIPFPSHSFPVYIFKIWKRKKEWPERDTVLVWLASKGAGLIKGNNENQCLLAWVAMWLSLKVICWKTIGLPVHMVGPVGSDLWLLKQMGHRCDPTGLAYILMFLWDSSISEHFDQIFMVYLWDASCIESHSTVIFFFLRLRFET